MAQYNSNSGEQSPLSAIYSFLLFITTLDIYYQYKKTLIDH